MVEQRVKISFFQRESLLIVSLFLLAFAVRLIYLNQIKLNPYFDTPQIDALWHHNWAKEIAGGDLMGKEVFFRAPLYPYFLGMVYALFGEGFYIPRLIQIIIGSLSCVLVFSLAKKLFNRPTGIIASLIACFYAPLIYFDAELLIPVLIIFLDSTLILILLNAQTKLKRRWWLVAGTVLGLSAIARPNILILAPFVLLWMGMEFRRENRKKMASSGLFFLLGMILVIFPVTLRNWVVGKDLVLISSQGGINFFIGNNIESEGKTAMAAPGSRPYDGYKDNVWITSVRLAEGNLGKNLKPSQISGFWYKQAFHFVKTHPLKYFQLLGKKLYYFWNSYEMEGNKNMYFFSRWSSLLRLLLWDWVLRFPFGLICPLSILGIILSTKRCKECFFLYAFVASYMLSVILFFVTSRFRLPVIPFLIIFASNYIYWLLEKIKNRQARPVLISFSILVPLFLITNSNLFGVSQANASRNYHSLGIVYSKKGWYDSAVATYQKGLQINPSSAELHRNLGYAYYKKGYYNLAVDEYQQAVSLNPQMAVAYNDLGYIYNLMDRDQEALEAYEKALEIDSALARARVNLALLFEKKELYKEAASQYQIASELEPQAAEIHNNLGNAYVKLGYKDKASAEFKEALELDPNYVYAHLNLGNVYFEERKYQMAIAQYERALKLDPKMIQAYRNLAIAYLETNQPYKAIEVLKAGLKTNPNAPELKRLLERLSGES